MVQANSLTLNKVLVVVGPTASGKSSLAVQLAKKYDGEIISADSVSIYRGLDVGSAKPTEQERDGVKHYMIDVVSPSDEFSVAEYERTALPIINDVISRGKLPIICGGTGFYVNSLLYELSYGLGGANLEIRNKYKKLAETEGKECVWRKLQKVDPLTAEKLHYNDLVRVIRALEIFYTSGKKKSEIVDELKPRFNYLAIAPDFPREVLYERINRRVDLMRANGLEDEVRGLIADGITLDYQCMQGIGYKETYAAIIDSLDFPSELIKQNSRRYAKRQITFFKKLAPISYEQLDANKDIKLYKIIDNFIQN